MPHVPNMYAAQTAQTAPTWVSYVALAFSGFAVIVSIVTAIVGIATFRRAGARLRVQFNWTATDEDMELSVSVANSGLGAVTVDELRVAISFVGALLPIAHLSTDNAYTGPDLPVRIDGNHKEKWVFSLRECAAQPPFEDWDNLSVASLIWSFAKRFPLFLLLINFLPGLIVTAELGSGIEVASRPHIRALLHLFREREKLNFEWIENFIN